MSGEESQKKELSLTERKKLERSSHQGIVRGHINKIRKILLEDNVRDISACEKQLAKLTAAQAAFNIAHDDYVIACASDGVTPSEQIKLADLLSEDAKVVSAEAAEWIITMSSRRKSGEFGTLESTSIHGSSVSGHVGAFSPESFSIVKHSADDSALLEEYEGKMDEMKKRIHELEFQAGETETHRRENKKLQNALRDQKDRDDTARAAYNDTVRDLQQQLHDIRTKGDTSTIPAMDPSFNRSTFGQEELFAISQVMQQSNHDMMRDLLDHSMKQQRSLFTNMRAPQVELLKFDGSPITYCKFITRFDELIGGTDDTDSVKLTTLLQHCSEKVLVHLDCCNYKAADEGYRLARTILKLKYGNPYLIAQAWVEKLTDYPKLRSPELLQQFSGEIKSAMDSLRSLGFLSELECTKSLTTITAKLPNYLQNRWRTKYREAMHKGRIAKLKELVELIENAAEEANDPVYGQANLEKVSAAIDTRTKTTVPTRKKTSYVIEEHETEEQFDCHDVGETAEEQYARPRREVNVQREKTEAGTCYICKGAHYTSNCFTFIDMSSQERLRYVMEHKLCLLCLGTGHRVESCVKTWVCRRPGCQQKHNGNLHQALTARTTSHVALAECATVPESEREETDQAAATSSIVRETQLLSMGLPHRDRVKYINMLTYRLEYEHSLPVIPVILRSYKGFFKTNALIDTGSSATLCTRRVQTAMQYHPIATQTMWVKGVAGEKEVTSEVVQMELKGMVGTKFLKALEVTFLDDLEIAEGQVARLQDLQSWEHLKHLVIPQHGDYETVDVLIGQDNAHLFKTISQIEGDDEYQPYAVETPLGWTIFGHYTAQLVPRDDVKSSTMSVNKCQRVRRVLSSTGDGSLERTLANQWLVDEVPDVKPCSPINKKILNDWEKNIVLKDGHWEVPIQFKNDPPYLRDNYSVIRKKLDQLGRRLNKRPDIKEQYVRSMQENFKKGYACEATRVPYPGYEYYHPHQEVITPRRPGKCRIVGNLSFVVHEESLNTAVYQGPDLTTPLIEVLIQFRLYRYAFTTDIAAMYNQVRVPEKQRDSLRFLWWKNDEVGGEVIPCQMITHMFGGGWCPSVTSFALQHTARTYSSEYDEIVVRTILKNFYVDDLLKSILSITSGVRLIAQLQHILARVGFSLAKFGANDLSLLSGIPRELMSKAYEDVEMELTDEVQDKTLGTTWGPKQDVFGFSTIKNEKPCTRRGILSTFSSVYDPLGFVAPFVLKARQIIQELCAEGYSWDEQLPQQFHVKWKEWTDELSVLSTFQIPRWLGVDEANRERLQLHAFSDASEKGYGVALYLCIQNEAGAIVQARLLMAKARVSPIKTMSIPRLELVAAVLSAKMVKAATGYIEEKLLPAIFWIDSMIVLYYIRQQAREFRTFVANRVSYVHDITEPEQWRHVPGEMNAADRASRGISARELVHDAEWLGGPKFLFDRDQWPEQPEEFHTEEAEVRKRSVACVHVYRVEQEKKRFADIERLFTVISEWVKVIRIIGYLSRLVDFCKKRVVKKGKLTGPEFEKAELLAIKISQRCYLTESQMQSKMFLKLFPFDDQGVQRVGGRLMLSQLRFEEKYPAILPMSPCAELYIRYIHVRMGHVGVERTFMEVRRRYWLVGGKALVKKVVHRCLTCRKIRGRPGEQIMAPLPAFRVNPGKVPFENVGIDYAGPIYVKRGRVTCKRWICVITCFAIRSVHLELAFELSTSSFLCVLQRFIARRGKPTLIVSDNGTNFVGAVREMKQALTAWNQSRIESWMMEEEIEWQFNTPTASHHGGAWERMIRTYRELTMAVAGQQSLTDESAMTYLCHVEQIMNSRPLCRVSEDPGDDLPLTPNHLLMVPKTVHIPGVYEGRDGLQRRWKQTEYMADLFWRRWVGTYLRTLQERKKWFKKQRPFAVGDLVLLTSETTARLKWPLGVVLELFPGVDGMVRSVRVKTQDGVYERPISKLVRLECDY